MYYGSTAEWLSRVEIYSGVGTHSIKHHNVGDKTIWLDEVDTSLVISSYYSQGLVCLVCVPDRSNSPADEAKEAQTGNKSADVTMLLNIQQQSCCMFQTHFIQPAKVAACGIHRHPPFSNTSRYRNDTTDRSASCNCIIDIMLYLLHTCTLRKKQTNKKTSDIEGTWIHKDD